MNDKFNRWFQELKRLAEEKRLSHLIRDKEFHRQAFEDGESPEDVLEDLFEGAL